MTRPRALWVSPSVHKKIKTLSAQKGVPINKLLEDLFPEEPHEGRRFRGFF